MITTDDTIYREALKTLIDHPDGRFGVQKVVIESDISDKDIVELEGIMHRAKQYRDDINELEKVKVIGELE